VLGRQPAGARLVAQRGVERRGVQRRVDALERGARGRAARAVEQPRGRGHQRLERRALAGRRLAQIAREPLPRDQRLVRGQQRVARGPQLAGRRRLRADHLVDRPRGDRRPAQSGDLLGLVAPAVGAQALGQGVARRHELVERQPVERVDLVTHAPRLAGRRASRRAGRARSP
jgi:hypothetical protein